MKAAIFGGGKIARGFIAQLLQRSNYDITFIDVNTNLVKALNQNGKYYVNVMGNEKESEWITGFHCISSEDISTVASSLLESDVVFSSVGGKNLNSLSETIAQAFVLKAGKWGNKQISLITCENWKNPAKQLQEFILEKLSENALKEEFIAHIGISEAAILRSGIEPTEEMLAVDVNTVSVTNYWELPVDAERLKGNPIPLLGIKYTHNFEKFLQRKIYTFNTTNATIAYIGILKGFKYLADAANDPEICEIVEKVHGEMNPAIASALGVSLEEQQHFSEMAKQKYQDRSVTDFLERHGRDPVRKLGPEDRIVGTARLIEKEGGVVDALAVTLAAAIYYQSDNHQDETAMQLMSLREQLGVDGVLTKICMINPEESLGKKVKEKIDCLKKKGWIHG